MHIIKKAAKLGLAVSVVAANRVVKLDELGIFSAGSPLFLIFYAHPTTASYFTFDEKKYF